MQKFLWIWIACMATLPAQSQEAPRKMSRDELLRMLPGTKVTHVNQGGSERHWVNNPDGKLVANTNNKIFGSALGTQNSSGPGTWTVNDEGRYCIEIDWRRINEKWCSSILKGEGDTYYLGVADDKHRIEFAR